MLSDLRYAARALKRSSPGFSAVAIALAFLPSPVAAVALGVFGVLAIDPAHTLRG